MSRWRQDANGATTVLGTVLGTGQPRGNSLSHSANVTAEPAGGGSPRHKGTGSEARDKEPGRRPPLEPLDTREMGGHVGCGGGRRQLCTSLAAPQRRIQPRPCSPQALRVWHRGETRRRAPQLAGGLPAV